MKFKKNECFVKHKMGGNRFFFAQKKSIKIGFDGLLTRNEMLIKSWVQKERVKSRWHNGGCATTTDGSTAAAGSYGCSNSGRLGSGS